MIEKFDGERYYQPGAAGLEIKKNFLHTAEKTAPILEWKAAKTGKVNIDVAYVKNVNGDKNPAYPDGVQLLVYKGQELLFVENVDISVTEEKLAQVQLKDVQLSDKDSLYCVIDPRENNAYDGGSLYAAISEAGKTEAKPGRNGGRVDNNANNVRDFGTQGSNGWNYMYGTKPGDCRLVSNEKNGEYMNNISPNLSLSQGFIHPSLNHNAVLCWIPARNGDIDLRVKYAKFEQHDGNPKFPDGVKVRIFKNSELLYEQHVDAPDKGENKIRFRKPRLSVTTGDRLYFMVDPEKNASYDGGAFNISILDIAGLGDEGSVKTDAGQQIRQNFADVKYDFGLQGSNGWIFQSSYEDDPFGGCNTDSFNKADDRYFEDNYLEIKRDYVNPGEDGRSPVIKWRVAQDGRIRVNASYTKMKNEDKNPSWPDGTRVSLYHGHKLLKQEIFAPDTGKEITKRMDVSELSVKKGDYITMVINGLENNAYDGGKYEFSISSLSGLVGDTEQNIKPIHKGKRTNFASSLEDFGS